MYISELFFCLKGKLFLSQSWERVFKDAACIFLVSFLLLLFIERVYALMVTMTTSENTCHRQGNNICLPVNHLTKAEKITTKNYSTFFFLLFFLLFFLFLFFFYQTALKDNYYHYLHSFQISASK